MYPRFADRHYGAPGGRGDRAPSRPAFTLTEMLVVIGIVVLLALVAIPAVNQMWEQRKVSEAETILRGALMNARQRALGNTDVGLLFHVDKTGTQHIHLIQRQDEPSAARFDESGGKKCPDMDDQAPGVRVDLISTNRFVILPGQSFTMPKPMRAAPSSTLLPPGGGRKASFERYSDEELANNDFDAPVGYSREEELEPQRHRNFFAVVFSPQGQLLVARDVLIYDEDSECGQSGDAGAGRGDVSGMKVFPTVTLYLSGAYRTSGDEQPRQVDPTNPDANLAHMIYAEVSSGDVAVNFPSVRGVVIYDDSEYQRLSTGAHRQFLLDTARPYYISANSGDIIRGPIAADGAT